MSKIADNFKIQAEGLINFLCLLPAGATSTLFLAKNFPLIQTPFAF